MSHSCCKRIVAAVPSDVVQSAEAEQEAELQQLRRIPEIRALLDRQQELFNAAERACLKEKISIVASLLPADDFDELFAYFERHFLPELASQHGVSPDELPSFLSDHFENLITKD